MRARYPDQEGYVERSGVRTSYEMYGDGTPTVLFLPAWAIGHSRFWKGQIPYFARHYRVITFDPRGNGKSGRPLDPAAYADTEYTADALAVMDATQTDRAVMVGFSRGAWLAAMLAARYPDRVLGAVMAGSSSPLGELLPERTVHSFDDPLETEEGWAKSNRHYWHKDYRGFLEFFYSKVFTEPHSTKQIEDGVSWGLETTPEVLIATHDPHDFSERLKERRDEALAFYRSIRCPLLIIHGDQDAVVSYTRGVAIAEATGTPLITIAGGGHHNFGRDPVKTNLLLREFIDRIYPQSNFEEEPDGDAERAER
ncbi:MAG: alpha/beta hydrolase [Bacillati bacterium ANGP1]|uniref:Alpha/beta hydrolase n=2 Tax=Candidatus Segetimicrobium genomatis TaxID=2569760 RepID=A0A537LQ85_9BACT|nr:MAG: alpha/beta hydrolase [Terrabacteria group bacterium ANGP1]TMJ10156.1 MAG: alpha/beta hydrolase [Terrabacteria group bacterium ANGP1]